MMWLNKFIAAEITATIRNKGTREELSLVILSGGEVLGDFEREIDRRDRNVFPINQRRN